MRRAFCCSGQGGQQLLRKLAERIIARAHYDHPVTGAGELDDAGGAIIAGRVVFGLPTVILDQSDDPFAALALVDGAAKIDWIAQDCEVVRSQLAGESFGEFRAHLAQRAKAMRLEESEYSPRMGLQGAQCGGDFVGVVAEVVDM